MISRIAVVGAGLMGTGIAETAASAGVDVIVYEPEEAPLRDSRSRLEKSITRAVERAKLTAENAESLVSMNS